MTTNENVLIRKKNESCSLMEYYEKQTKTLKRHLEDIHIIQGKHDFTSSDKAIFDSLEYDTQQEHSWTIQKLYHSRQDCLKYKRLLSIIQIQRGETPLSETGGGLR